MFYNNYVDQCNKAGLSPSAAAEAMGFKRSVVTRWANGTNPRQATLQKIATFFGCTVSDLLKENKNTAAKNGDGMSAEDLALFNKFSHAEQWLKDQILSLLEAAESAHAVQGDDTTDK